jgi:low affinity Fe/Cu permease
MRQGFRSFANRASNSVGSPWAFVAGAVAVLIWALSGRAFHYSDTWQLVINTGTSIVTFLVVFLIQNTQNRDTEATQLKLNELIRAVSRARNEMLDLEDCTEEEIAAIRDEFKAIRDKVRVRQKDTPAG